MANAQHNGSGGAHRDPDGLQAPSPVPELDPGEGRDLAATPAPRPGGTVTDDDRNRFGTLLDHAVERGLLGPGEYQVRLRELAQATSIEEMTEIVSALPAFAASPSPAKQHDSIVDPLASATLPARTERRNPPWALLVVVIVVIAVALVALGLIAAHAVHNHNGSGQSTPVVVSVPRL